MLARASDDTLCDLPPSVSSSLTLVTATDEDVDALVDLHTPLTARPLPEFAGNTDPKSLLPAEPMELFPASRSENLQQELEEQQSPEENLLVDLSGGDGGGSADRLQRKEPTHSESSESNGTSAELTEILESARQSDRLDTDANR